MADSIALRARAVAIRPTFEVIEGDSRPMAPSYPGTSLSTAQLARLAAHVVGDAFGLEAIRLKGRRRGARRLAHGRTVAVALVHLVCGRSQEDVARCFNRNRTTASHHMEMVEALNDVPEHEAFWDLLVRRFELYVELAQLPSSYDAWKVALAGIDEAMDEGTIEGEAVDQAKHVRGVFWEDRIRG